MSVLQAICHLAPRDDSALGMQSIFRASAFVGHVSWSMLQKHGDAGATSSCYT